MKNISDTSIIIERKTVNDGKLKRPTINRGPVLMAWISLI